MNKNKTCDTCCFGHKCSYDGPCEFYCSTATDCEADEEYIEKERAAFYAEWFTYTELFYE